MNESAQDYESAYANEKIPASKVARYADIRKEAEAVYKTYGKLQCPALRGKEVSFTSEGFNHLVYRIKKQEREKSVQILRFELIPKAKELVEKSTFLQEYEEYPRLVEVQRNKKKFQKIAQFKDFGLFGIVGGYRIKVVLRKIGDGEIKFHSVIPAWSTKYYRDIKIIRNTKGNVAED